MAAKTWTGEWWKLGGGGTAWDAIVYDPELRLLYVGTGNGSPWARKHRSPGGGDNLYLCSILALDPDTGELVWHYQTTPGDNWDFTSTQPLMLADLESLEKRIVPIEKRAKTGEKDAEAEYALIMKALNLLRDGKPARLAELSREESEPFRQLARN